MGAVVRNEVNEDGYANAETCCTGSSRVEEPNFIGRLQSNRQLREEEGMAATHTEPEEDNWKGYKQIDNKVVVKEEASEELGLAFMKKHNEEVDIDEDNMVDPKSGQDGVMRARDDVRGFDLPVGWICA